MNFAYGVSSGVEMKNPDGSLNKKGSSSMANIISHTDNLKDDLAKRINNKIN